MKSIIKLKLRLAEVTGAVTEEFSFIAVIALLIVGVLAAVTKSPIFTTLFLTLFQDVFHHFTSWLGGFFS